MQKKAPKILAVVLLVTIAALLLVAGGGDLQKFFNGIIADAGNKNDLDGGGDNPVIPDDTENPPPSQTGEEEENNENKDGGEINLINNYPKSPKTDGIYPFSQTIEIDGDITLKDVRRTSSGVFIIVESDAVGGDFGVEKRCVSVIKMDTDGLLEKVIHLTAPEPSSYLASQITPSGLQVTVDDGLHTYVFHINASLEVTGTLELPRSSSAAVFPFTEGYILLCCRTENTVYLIKNGEIVKTAPVSSGSILDIIELEKKFVLFINGINGYNIVSLDKSLNGVENTVIPNKTLLKIQPILEKGAQAYIAAEREGNSVSLTKYSASFRPTGDSVSLGIWDKTDIYTNGSTIFIISEKEDSSRLYLCDYDLSTILVGTNHLQNVTRLYYCLEYADGYYMLTERASSLCLIDVRNNGVISEYGISENPEKAMFLRKANSDLILFYSNDGESNIIHIKAISY